MLLVKGQSILLFQAEQGISTFQSETSSSRTIMDYFGIDTDLSLVSSHGYSKCSSDDTPQYHWNQIRNNSYLDMSEWDLAQNIGNQHI